MGRVGTLMSVPVECVWLSEARAGEIGNEVCFCFSLLDLSLPYMMIKGQISKRKMSKKNGEVRGTQGSRSDKL